MKTKSSLTLTLVVIAAIGGYSLGATKTTVPTASDSSYHSPLFQKQIATVLGKVVKIDPQTITVVNDKGNQQDFPLAKKFVIYKALKPSSAQASASSDIKLVEKDKTVLLMLEFIDNKYQVVSISDLPNVKH